jgi:hypothetical protein
LSRILRLNGEEINGENYIRKTFTCCTPCLILTKSSMLVLWEVTLCEVDLVLAMKMEAASSSETLEPPRIPYSVAA